MLWRHLITWNENTHESMASKIAHTLNLGYFVPSGRWDEVMAHFTTYFLLSRRRANSNNEFRSKQAHWLLSCCYAIMPSTLHSDKRNFCKQAKNIPSARCLGMISAVVITGFLAMCRILDKKKKKRNTALAERTVLTRRQQHKAWWHMQHPTSSLMVDDLIALEECKPFRCIFS